MSDAKKISAIQNQKKRKNWGLLIALVTAAVLLLAFVFMQYQSSKQSHSKDESVSKFSQDVDAARVKSIKVTPDFLFQKFEVELKDGEKYKFTGPHLDSRDTREMALKGVQIDYQKSATDWRAAPGYMMTLLLLAIVITTVGQSMGLSFTKAVTRSDTLLDDISGNEEAKGAVMEVVNYLKNPSAFGNLGAKFPKGLMLVGPPGTGKTMLAKGIAGEAKANFMAVSGSDFSSMFVGVSGMKIRSTFMRARRNAPCVLFIDEIDAVGGHRLSEGTATAREMGSSLNSMLVMMDGFEDNSGVVVIAATNRIELLDPALLRSGRFDRHVYLQLPTQHERVDILKQHGKKIKLGEFDYSALAKACIGMSGADLANVVNQAALMAVQDGSQAVQTRHGLMGRDRVMMGDPRMSQARGMSLETKRLLAAHELGHAIVGMVHGPDAVTRISILPRGRSLGQTMFEPAEDVLVLDQDKLLGHIRMLLGGRAAELTVARTQTTGASDDLQRASKLAMDLVMRYGMGNQSLICIDEKSSDSLRRQAEDEANKIMEHCLTEANETIQRNRTLFNEMVERLIAEEEINEVDVNLYMSRVIGKKLGRPDAAGERGVHPEHLHSVIDLEALVEPDGELAAT